MKEPDRSRDDVLGALGDVARRAWTDDASPAADLAGERRLLVELAAPMSRRPRFGLVAALGVAVTCALVALTLFIAAPRALEYRVAGSSENAFGYLQPAASGPALAQFTDGTEVRVAPGGRARIVETTRHGARLSLEQGLARFSVVHRDRARWSVEAGPFSIAVTGTEFDADWSGSGGTLRVELRKGSVTVTGPLAPDGVGLRAGQRLLLSVPNHELRIEELPSLEPPPLAEPVPPPPAPLAPAPIPTTDMVDSQAAPAAPASSTPAPTDVAAATSWSKRVAAGDFDGVVTDAESRGLATTLSSASLSDLAAFADAARYTGHLDAARGALLALRKRFPTSTDGRNAAFFLGRLAEDRGAPGEAIGFYDQYVAGAPRGMFVAEALGRKMLAVEKTSGRAAAGELASDYLRRFPRGPYANAAKELTAER